MERIEREAMYKITAKYKGKEVPVIKLQVKDGIVFAVWFVVNGHEIWQLPTEMEAFAITNE